VRLIALVVLAGGCWGSPSPPHDTPTADRASAPLTEHEQPRRLVWEGHYVCAQGKTALTLTLEGGPDALTGTFEFGPLPENPGVPHGKYTLRGKAIRIGDGIYDVELAPGQWIEHPDSYYMVGLRATSSREHDTLMGRITDRNCGEVMLSRRP